MLFIISFVIACQAARSQSDNENIVHTVLSATTLEVGTSHLMDTYLTPIKYERHNFGITNERVKLAGFSKDRIMTQQRLAVNLSVNRSLLSLHMAGAFVDYSYGMLYVYRPLTGLKLMAGAEVMTTVGGTYNTNLSNNPGSAKFNLNLGITGMAVYTFRIRNYPVTARFQITTPALGMFFSPAYGESYYEIFDLGNRKGIMRFGSFHNQRHIRNLLTVDFPAGPVKIRIGYQYTGQKTWASGLFSSFHYQQFVFGITKEFVPLSQRNKSKMKHRRVGAFYD